ncbi:hypothetical protein PFICI_04275 [Pestalotiopsis fici W106-1]|uniref:Zn(2)-C6 fungal-type domain-containing protein n=1 Tax=Pestalotiopsis fici (strain W106-1 / CGMCC3.15140) TaxID=1229662 RepID=W3X8P9_PESFW|nr:uncharacterized protein PFICI_04275 [Pestalotiopsis fici W106-1]ETS82399.1 hypothetical protein PFICI_04275 [Pestalotiopsis fici W106-1]
MSTAPRALQACRPCKQQKRKCDKSQPICGLCERSGRSCDYSSSVPVVAPTTADLEALQSRLDELESRLNNSHGTPPAFARTATQSVNSSNDDASQCLYQSENTSSLHTPPSAVYSRDEGASRAHAALFLDIDCYKWSGFSIKGISGEIPVDVLALLTQGDAIMDVYAAYFDTVHTWFPVVSKKRIDLGIPMRHGGPELAVLFLAMKLLVTLPKDVTNSPVYVAVKQFLSLLEARGCCSFTCLQAMMLVALYEYSHAIYPGAWMTVGACSRYADIIGVTGAGSTLDIVHSVTTWSEAEERRRIWWGMYILDRAISIGSRRRFSMPEPSENSTLPSDDSGWDRGDAMRAVNLSVTTDPSVRQSPFARLCQSAMLLSRAMQCISLTGPPESQQNEVFSVLSDQLMNFLSVVDSEVSSTVTDPDNSLLLLGPRCLTGSALFLILDIFSCPEKMSQIPGYISTPGAKSNEELQRQVWASSLLKRVTEAFAKFGTGWIDTLNSSEDAPQLGQFPSLALDAFYSTMATLLWYRREGMEDWNEASLAHTRRILQVVGARWKAASHYVQIAERSYNTICP